MAELAGKAAAGDVKAKAELKRMEMQDPAKEAKDEASALHAKLAAKRALSNPVDDKQRLLEEEQKRAVVTSNEPGAGGAPFGDPYQALLDFSNARKAR